MAQAVDPISEDVPITVAYGMANPRSLQAGLNSLNSQGLGLLPHSEISNWIRSMTQKVIESEGWTVDASHIPQKIPDSGY